MTKVCNNCGKSVEESHKFCPGCGTSIENEIENTILICNNCGSENSVNNFFCSECGVKLDNKSSKEVTDTSLSQTVKSIVKKPVKNKKNKKSDNTFQQKITSKEKTLSKEKCPVLGVTDKFTLPKGMPLSQVPKLVLSSEPSNLTSQKALAAAVPAIIASIRKS